MKFVGVREAQAQLSGLVEQSQSERIVLTRHGQPIAMLTGLEGQDLEAILLARDANFRQLIGKRRHHRGPLVSHEELRAETERELAAKRRARQQRANRRRVSRKRLSKSQD